jgi:hypothetical protein
MPTCIICRRETILDDVALARDERVCVCLRCQERQTGAALPLPKALRKAVTSAMGDGKPVHEEPLPESHRVEVRRRLWKGPIRW